jgi:hypothetical protein
MWAKNSITYVELWGNTLTTTRSCTLLHPAPSFAHHHSQQEDEANKSLAAPFSDLRNKGPSALTTDHLEQTAHV